MSDRLEELRKRFGGGGSESSEGAGDPRPGARRKLTRAEAYEEHMRMLAEGGSDADGKEAFRRVFPFRRRA